MYPLSNEFSNLTKEEKAAKRSARRLGRKEQGGFLRNLLTRKQFKTSAETPPEVREEAKSTANQLYKKEIARTGKSLPFKDWLAKAKSSGLLGKVMDRAYDKLNIKPPEKDIEGYGKNGGDDKKTEILGMPPLVVYTGGAVLITLTIWGILSLLKRKK